MSNFDPQLLPEPEISRGGKLEGFVTAQPDDLTQVKGLLNDFDPSGASESRRTLPVMPLDSLSTTDGVLLLIPHRSSLMDI
jgi:hypothetical protein